MDFDKERRGFPKPLPEKIREAREARGYTLETLAEALGVSKQAVAQYETGQSAPGGEVMSGIVTMTRQPLSFFTTPRARRGEPSSPYWRSLVRMDLVHRRRIGRRLQWVSDIVDYVSDFIEVPAVNIVRSDFEADYDQDQQIECAAEALRELWNLGDGPIRDLAATLEENGVVIVREPVSCSDMDGVSCWVGGRPYILLSGEVESGPRDLFNLAHELGHLVLHAGVDIDSTNLKRIEAQANRFASAFLLPRQQFAREVFGTSIAHFLSLKRRWGVAISAMAYRCKDLEIISQDQFSYIMRQMNAQRIRRIEPLDDAFCVSEPRMLRQAIEMLVEHGVQSRAQIEEALVLNLTDVESLCGLRVGYLDNRVVKLRFREA